MLRHWQACAVLNKHTVRAPCACPTLCQEPIAATLLVSRGHNNCRSVSRLHAGRKPACSTPAARTRT